MSGCLTILSLAEGLVPLWDKELQRFADPGRGAERLSERLFGSGPDAEKRMRSRVLKDVA